MFRRVRLPAVIALGVLALLAPTVQAGDPFARSTTTAGGNPTWDSDLINVEAVTQTGAGVYVAVLDTGLVPNWSDYFPKARIAVGYGTGFEQAVTFKAKSHDPCGLMAEVGALRQTSFIGSRTSGHGTHVTSTIIGYSYRSNTDAAQGYPLPPVQVRGIAPDATIIPVKVLADYQQPALPSCPDPAKRAAQAINFGTDGMVAAGIDYVTGLKTGPLTGKPIVINMSLGDSVPSGTIKAAIDRAIAAGVIVVASAGNEGDAGMGWPGAYPEVISAGAAGWVGEWLDREEDAFTKTAPEGGVRYRMFWLQDPSGDLTPPLKVDSGQVADPTTAGLTYVADFSSRQKAGQELDVLAPGTWVRGPLPGTPGYNHLPWWSKGLGDLAGHNSGNFFYVGGTSMAAPHVSALAALMLEKAHDLAQTQVESLMRANALPVGAGSRDIWDPFAAIPGFYPVSWGSDATGAGLIQVDATLAATP